MMETPLDGNAWWGLPGSVFRDSFLYSSYPQ